MYLCTASKDSVNTFRRVNDADGGCGCESGEYDDVPSCQPAAAVAAERLASAELQQFLHSSVAVDSADASCGCDIASAAVASCSAMEDVVASLDSAVLGCVEIVCSKLYR